MRKNLRTLGLILCFGCLACIDNQSRPTSSATDEQKAVRAVVVSLIAADNAGDLEAVMRQYGSDPVLMPPGREAIRGRAAVRSHYARLLADTDMDLDAESVETVVTGDWAFDRGFTMGSVTPRGGETVQIYDRYLMLLQRESEGAWKASRLIWHAGPEKKN